MNYARTAVIAAAAGALLLLAGCGGKGGDPSATTGSPSPGATAGASATASASPITTPSPSPSGSATKTPSPSSSAKPSASAPASPATAKPGGEDALQVVAKPDSITVLVNKQYALPKEYEPSDLVYPNVAFTFSEKLPKRMMRKEAAAALETLFAGAKKDGIALAGVSAYRSYATQKTLFDNYVKQDGLEKARQYSAYPGTSEHETGLAIDVSGADGKCAATDCFATTKEAKWLDQHVTEYGFIIRYPKGKDAITGYQYEPWHLRYVGVDVSKAIASKGVTMEEYYNAVPVNK